MLSGCGGKVIGLGLDRAKNVQSRATMVNDITSLFFAKEMPLFTLLNTQRNLAWGFLHLFPLGGDTVLLDAYKYFVHDKWNAKHQDRIARTMLAFDVANGKDREKDPIAFEDLRLRREFQEEQNCLEEELRAEFPGITCGNVTLKDQYGNWTTRWLEVFLNSENLVGQKRKDVAKKIVTSTDLQLIDYNIFAEHAKSGGRSKLGRFSQGVATSLERKVSEILREYEIVYEKGSLSGHEELLKKIDERFRNIIFMNSIYDLFSQSNALLQGNALVQLLQRFDAYKKPELLQEFIVPGNDYTKIFSDLERQLLAVNVAALEEELQQKVSKEDNDSLLLESARVAVLTSSLAFHKALKDVCTLLKVHLVKDFTPEEIRKAMEEKAMQAASSPITVASSERKSLQQTSHQQKEKLSKSSGATPLAATRVEPKKGAELPRNKAFSVSIGSLQDLGPSLQSPRSDRGRSTSPISSPGRSGLTSRAPSALSPSSSPRSPRSSPRVSDLGSAPLSRRVKTSNFSQRGDQAAGAQSPRRKTGTYQPLPPSPPSSPRDPSKQASLINRRSEMVAVLEITERVFSKILYQPQK